MKPVLQLKNVTKMYGSSIGIKNITLDVEKGAVFGFLGPNGAGKTTTISLLVDLIRPTSGDIKIFGMHSQKSSLAIRQRIGYLGGDMALDAGLTGREQLEFFANLRGGIPKSRINELAKRLECNLNRKIKTLSRGNRQKVGLISALMHDPELLILDEPTSGLDPLIQAEFNKIIMERKTKGKTAFISSHVLSEIQEVCDHAAFIREGKLIAVRHMTDIATSLPKIVTIVSRDTTLKEGLKQLKGLKIHRTEGSKIETTYDGDINALTKALSKYRVKDLVIQEADLETVFMKYYEEQNNA